ncbi:MAG TPA: S8 family serine peptidase [Pyrinomonadaceae bacterium]|nr:S8 family serine peptidase [Pyrinomonadaceae bacterium]
MKFGFAHLISFAKQSIALALVILVFVSPTMAGLNISSTNGIVMTGADGIVMTGADGIVMTGADGILNAGANGIVMTGADGIVMTGADGVAYPNSVRATSADGIVMTGADGIVMTGADGIVMTGADGATYRADSVTITLANGIVMTGADGIVMTGADGVERQAANGIVMTGADGIVMTGADGIVMTGADSVRATGADGVVFSVAPNGLRFTGVTGIVMTGADGIVMTGADGIVMTGADALMPNAISPVAVGLQSIDPALALELTQLADDSTVNCVVIYHQMPTDSDLADLQRVGIVGGTRFRALPMITLTGTRDQIAAISKFATVRSIYGNRTLNLNSEPEVRAVTGVERAWRDAEITATNGNLPVTGKNVTVAVLDTGVDGTHADLAGRVAKNIKLAGTQSASVGFNYPINSEMLSNTDQAYGHGTFVAGVIAGNGSLSGGKYAGVAPGARVVGLSAGDVTLLYVLEGLDYLLAEGAGLGVKVVNCSFSSNTVFDVNDPVNIATKMLTDNGVNVVFSAGNTGPGAHTLNPYAVAPWVISVGATDTKGRLASFSSRGDFANSMFHPTLVAPGVDVVSLRGSGIANVTGATGLAGADSKRLSAAELPYYTTANGTSFSAPQVAGAIALMLEANPNLKPSEVKDILQRTATPLPPYYLYESGTGMLNVHAAVLEAAFPSRLIGAWRGTMDQHQVEFLSDAPVQFSGTSLPGTATDINVTIPDGSITASIQISWGPMWSTNDLAMSVTDPSGAVKQANAINLTGLNGKHETLTFNSPLPGTWRVSVRNTLGALGSPQQFYGVLEVGRAQYARLNDVGTLSPGLRGDVYQSLRTFSMWPIGSRFRAEFGVSRADLATAMVMTARVPQYEPGAASYADVKDKSTRLFVESAQASPTGALFIDVTKGGQFRPNDNVSRLAAAVALVRAAGLRSEAEAKAGTPLPYLDATTVPSNLRGYVSVAVSTGLLQAGTNFSPQAAISRADLAHAITVIETRAVQ